MDCCEQCGGMFIVLKCEFFRTLPILAKNYLRTRKKSAIMGAPSKKHRQDGKEHIMSYFEEMTQKAKAAVSTAAGKAREVADSAKISAAIIAEKRELDKSYRALGQWYACEHAGKEIPEAVADVMAAIRASQEKIAELQASRDEAESAEASEPESGKVCPICGEIGNTKFCPYCGTPME